MKKLIVTLFAGLMAVSIGTAHAQAPLEQAAVNAAQAVFKEASVDDFSKLYGYCARGTSVRVVIGADKELHLYYSVGDFRGLDSFTWCMRRVKQIHDGQD